MSSSEIAVSVRGISKAYTIAQNVVQHTTAAEALVHRLRHPFQRVDRETYWALKDVSFDVQKGDVVGIIGRNGAGKSTLLKILSRITEPTQGEINLYGRVGSLLEVGTGFSGELTGRENIFLNGAILGMTKREITRQFDAIIDFAGVEQFLDTPVKRYSSGMYVRLAFAVAAHLNPEILIVDEVLAVGDAEFQDKCMGKMRDVASNGRTVLFVSHNMQAIALLCNKGIALREGRISYHGHVAKAIDEYMCSLVTATETASNPDRRPGSGEYRFTNVAPCKTLFDAEKPKEFRFRLERRKADLGKMYVSAHIVDSMGATISQMDSRLVGYWLHDADVIEGRLTIKTPWLKPGSYHLDMYVCAAGIVDKYEAACRFDVSPITPYDYSTTADGVSMGAVFADFAWDTTEEMKQKNVTVSVSGLARTSPTA